MANTNFSVLICPKPTITPQILPNGIVGVAYPTQTLVATGGTPPYSNWVVVANALPNGLTLNPANAQITGTPTANGVFNFTVEMTDSLGQTDTEVFSITVGNEPIPTLDNAPANGVCWVVGETMQFSVVGANITAITPTAPLTGTASGLGTPNASFLITGGSLGVTHNLTVNTVV